MSGFEFVLVLFAIIVGLGVSSILVGWGEQIRFRHRLEAYPLQIVWAAVILLFSMTYLWSLWTFHDLTWTFPLYLLVAAPGLILSLAAHIVRIDTSPDASAPREQYFRASGPIFLLLALIPLTLIAMSFVPQLRASSPNPPNLPAITGFRATLSIGLASLAWSKSERAHWVGAGLLLLTVLVLSARITVRMIQGAA